MITEMNNFLNEVHIIDDIDAKDLKRKLEQIQKLKLNCVENSKL